MECHSNSRINISNTLLSGWAYLITWSGSVQWGNYPKDSMLLASWLLKATLAYFRPYKALWITAVFLASLLNSGSNMVHSFNFYESSHKHSGALYHSSLQLALFLFLGIYGFNCFNWHATSLNFWKNLSQIISSTLLHTQASRMLSLANSNAESHVLHLWMPSGALWPNQSLWHLSVNTYSPSWTCSGKHSF